MFETVLKYLPYLGLVLLTHILLGVYYNVGELKDKFSWKVLLVGVAKAAIVSEAFIALALVMDKLTVDYELKALEIMPDVLLVGVIAIYVAKCIKNLKKIFTVTDDDLKEVGIEVPVTPEYSEPDDVVEHELPVDGQGEG